MKSLTEKCVLLAVVLTTLAGPDLTAPSGRQALAEDSPAADSPTYRSPFGLAISADGTTLYATDPIGGSVVILDTGNKAKRGEIALRGAPQGAALSADGGTLFVAEHGAGTVALIDTATHEVTSRIPVGKWPTAIAVADKTKRLYVCNQDDHTVSVIDLTQPPGKSIARIPVIREPSCVSVTPDERYAVVTNLLVYGVGTDPELAAEVSIIDTAALTVAENVKLPPGSTMVKGVCLSPDGNWAYVVHGLGRFNLPITQLERGWVNTFALTIIDMAKGERLVTMLLDDLTQGAADPHSVVCSTDGTRLWISHAGVHEISMIDIGRVHELLTGNVPQDLADLKDGTLPNIWVRIQQDRSQIAELENDLTALYIAGAIRRASSGGKGPRGIVLSPDNETLLVANYYSGSVAILDADDGKLQGVIPLGPEVEPNSVRRGELIFHDATHAFQRWHSCASCHANQGRIDGLRWDFMSDGIGNAKDTISLVNLHKTEPMNRRATVDKALACTRGGLDSTNMLVPTDQEVVDLYAYLTALRPVPSTHLTPDGGLTEIAQQGKALFEGKAGCVRCHPGPYFTDQKMHNVGVLSSNEPDGRYDTPSLVEGYRTAPYLHDGRALTLNDVLTVHNEDHLHGKTKELTEQEIDALVAYLLSL